MHENSIFVSQLQVLASVIIIIIASCATSIEVIGFVARKWLVRVLVEGESLCNCES